MSDLVGDGGGSGGRAAPSMRTPRDIMADRRAREARRQAEADRQRDEAQRSVDEERRRAAAMATERMTGDATMSEEVHATRPRSLSQSAPQPAKVHVLPGHRRSQTTQSGARVSSAPNPQQSSQANPRSEEGQQRSNVSSFPHAFERWEQLSSHWEGLTSYWLRKIEANTDEIRRTTPSAAALSRQIQDLSAAGANLFHAVVELQRLRASSERKFQRWFFETKAEQERSQEGRAELTRQLQDERDAREQATAALDKASLDVRNADRMVHEMRRELNISKAEARRAWEDLGRREAEQYAWIGNLRQGLPTVIGGVQVVPMHASAGVSHQGSERRPTTSEGASMPQSMPYQEAEPSPTNTDPFTESAKAAQHLHHEPDVQSLATGTYRPYPPGSTPASTSTARTAISPRQQTRSLSPTEAASMRAPHGIDTSQPSGLQPNQPTVAGAAQEHPELFYQQPPGRVYLHSSSAGPQSVIPDVPDAPQQSAELRSQPSYGTDTTEGTEYEIDEHGEVRRDAQGRPIIYNRPSRSSHARNESQESDEYDVAADVAHEREIAARYGMQPPEAPQAPATSAEAMASFVASAAATPGGYASVGPADYEGAGYGSWEALQSRHHHPTRLSDVLEEDERSRTTAE